jgi:hypothetical protein
MNPNYFTEVLLPLYIALQPKFREVMGEWKLSNDQFCWPDTRYILLRRELQNAEGYLIIPRTIDDSSEEARKRSLWGMVDWKRYSLHSHPNGKVWIEFEDSKFDGPMWLGLTSTEAILKALCVQWEVEIV